jgi:integration host factor subunit alpha
MTKYEIAQYLYDKLGGLTAAQASTYVEVVLDTIKNTLADGEDVMISGFGKFSIRDKKARMGRNPVTGEKLVIEARRVVTFNPAVILKDLVNEGAKKRKDKIPNSSAVSRK